MVDDYKRMNDFLLLKLTDFRTLSERLVDISENRIIKYEAEILLQEIKSTLRAATNLSRNTNLEEYVENRVLFFETEKNTLRSANKEMQKEILQLNIKNNKWSSRYNDLLTENLELKKKIERLTVGDVID